MIGHRAGDLGQHERQDDRLHTVPGHAGTAKAFQSPGALVPGVTTRSVPNARYALALEAAPILIRRRLDRTV